MWSHSEWQDRPAEIETRRLSDGEDDPCADAYDQDGRLIVGWAEATSGFTMQSRVNDAYWSLAMTLAWITYRTETAVGNIKSGRWAPTKGSIRELLSALRSGKLAAHGMFEGERIPHPIETAVWSNFEIVVKPMRFTGHTSLMPIVIAQKRGAPQTRLLATVPAAKVRKLWPAAKRTVVAETRCREYLVTEMRRSPERQPKSKRDFLADCLERFPGLSERAFERAWAKAKTLTGAAGWGKAGRRSSRGE
jgi:hypothetical protein